MAKHKKKSGKDSNLAKLAIITAILTLLSNIITLITKLVDMLSK